MAEFLISNVKKVRELTQEHSANKHIKGGWVLLSAATAASRESDGTVSRYILGWLSDEEPLQEHHY